MKLKRLLTSLNALTLVLSLVACSNTEDSDLDKEDETSAETSSKTSEENTTGSDLTEGTTGDESSDSNDGEKESKATNPQEFLDQVKDRCNYTIQLEYDSYRSAETITYGEYQTADSEKLEEIAYSATLYASYIYDLYYVDDVLLIECYQYISGYGYYYSYTQVYVNDGLGGCDYYYTYDLSNWSDVYHYSFEYASAFYTLTWFANSNLNAEFSYYASGTYIGEPCVAYTYSSYYSAYLFLSLGTDAAIGQSWAQSNASNYKHYLTYFFEDDLRMLTNFYRSGWSYTDSELTSETELFYQDVEIYGTIFNICNTEIPIYYTL